MGRLHEIAMGCAVLLNGNWRYLKNEECTEHQQRAVLQDNTQLGRQIIFSEYYLGEGRLQITGTYPNKYYTKHKITLAQSRSIPALSSDINRRFLPEYLKKYERAKTAYKENMDKQENLRIRVDLLKQIAPSISPFHSYKNEIATDYYLDGGKLRLSSYNNDAHLEIRISFEKLVRVLHLLRE